MLYDVNGVKSPLSACCTCGMMQPSAMVTKSWNVCHGFIHLAGTKPGFVPNPRQQVESIQLKATTQVDEAVNVQGMRCVVPLSGPSCSRVALDRAMTLTQQGADIWMHCTTCGSAFSLYNQPA
jgi:hypothetical protein